jgi:hypothetical protein
VLRPRGLLALIADAGRARIQRVGVRRLLDEMDAEFGPVPAEVAEDVARRWQARDRRPPG